MSGHTLMTAWTHYVALINLFTLRLVDKQRISNTGEVPCMIQQFYRLCIHNTMHIHKSLHQMNVVYRYNVVVDNSFARRQIKSISRTSNQCCFSKLVLIRKRHQSGGITSLCTVPMYSTAKIYASLKSNHEVNNITTCIYIVCMCVYVD